MSIDVGDLILASFPEVYGDLFGIIVGIDSRFNVICIVFDNGSCGIFDMEPDLMSCLKKIIETIGGSDVCVD